MDGEYRGQLDRLEDLILRVEKKIEKVDDKVDKINFHGCAHRTNDVSRIEKLEKWRDKGVAAVFILLVSGLAQFFGVHLRQ